MNRTLEVRTRREWRDWLQEHHATETDVWLVFLKGDARSEGMTYEDAVEEALCYGWIDSLVKRLDDARYARKFTPRKADSRWSTSNRRRYASLAARGLLAPPGVARAPTDRSGDAPRPSATVLSPDIEAGLQANPRAWQFFQQLAPSHRQAYIGWIESARRATTREKRLREAIAGLAAGRKPGLK